MNFSNIRLAVNLSILSPLLLASVCLEVDKVYISYGDDNSIGTFLSF